MRRRLRPAIPYLAALAFVALFQGHLLLPDALLSVRDIPTFHLPLRTSFAEVARSGMPTWNPRVYGGQPILSNPNYAAFYPPSWLSTLVPAHSAMSIIQALHGLLGFWGAWLLARRLGCGSVASLFAATAFAGGGGFFSASNAFNFYCSAAWLPLALLAADQVFEKGSSRRLLPASSTALILALQLAAGEPMVALATSLGVACLALTKPCVSLRLRRLSAVAVLTVLFSAVQLLPTISQVRSSARSETSEGAVSVWSARPSRLLEFVLPRLYGDPLGIDQGRYFGWNQHDLKFPYLLSVYGGQLTAMLAVAGLLFLPIPRRRVWIALFGVGFALALGRHNPLYRMFDSIVPLGSLLRYPEKFLILCTAALPFAGALTLQRLLDHREREEPLRRRLVLASAGALTLLVLLPAMAFSFAPRVAARWVQNNAHTPLAAADLQVASSYLSGQAWVTSILALLALAVVVILCSRTPPTRTLVAIALVVLIADLALNNRGLAPAMRHSDLVKAPRGLAGVDPGTGRLFTDAVFRSEPAFVPPDPRPGPDVLWSQVARAEPYLGNLWGFDYVFHVDFDHMTTEPARTALRLLAENAGNFEATHNLLTRWGVRYLARTRPTAELERAYVEGKPLDPIELEVIDGTFPFLSWEKQVEWKPDVSSALESAASGRFATPHWVSGSARPTTIGSRPQSVSDLSIEPNGTSFRYEAHSPLLLRVGTTWDRGWRATLDRERIPIFRSAIGQIGAELPAGNHAFELEFRTPFLRLGATVTLLTLLGLGAVFAISRRGPPRSP